MDESKKKDRYEDAKKFVRYSDGAKMYSMGMTKFQEVAKDAKACYKIGQLVLVNTEILDKYPMTGRQKKRRYRRLRQNLISYPMILTLLNIETWYRTGKHRFR